MLKKKHVILLIFILVLSLTICSISFGALVSNTDKTKINLSQYLSALEKNKNFQGSVLVEKDGKVLIDNVYGMSDVEKKIKNTNKSTFPIGSVTKQFTALAIMQLQQKKLLNVKDKLSKYIPDYPRGNDITLHNLLTHTSGISNFPYLNDIAALGTGNIKIQDIINFLKKKTLVFEPGKIWSYSNSGYVLLGYIVEKVSKLSLEIYLQKNIFIPLKMNSTGVCYKNGKKMYDTNGYTGFLEVIPVDDAPLLKVAFGAGFLYSTVKDLALWDRALYTEKLVSKKTLNEIFTPYEYTGNMGYYGYGWVVSGISPIKEVFHGGNTTGFTSIISMNLEKNLRIIILSNKARVDLNSLKNTLSDIAFGKKFSLPLKQKEIKISPENYNIYIGTYQVNPDLKIIISKEENQLYAQLTGQARTEIYPESATKFFCKIIDSKITFVYDSKNVIKSLSLDQNGQNTIADKISDIPETRKEIQVDSKIYDACVGDYELSPGFIITITKENNQIFAQATGQQKFEIFPESETNFFYKVVDAQIIFVIDDNGAVTGAILKQAGQKFDLKKI